MLKMRLSSARLPSVLEVRLADTLVGTLTNLPNDQNLFVFDAGYISDPNRPVLSLSFLDAYREVRTEVRAVTRRLPPFFSNLLPEGQMRKYIAEHGEVSEQREFFLLWLLGKDLPGAVSVHDIEGRELPPTPECSRRRSQAGRERRAAIFARRRAAQAFRDRQSQPSALDRSFQPRRPLDCETAFSGVSSLARE